MFNRNEAVVHACHLKISQELEIWDGSRHLSIVRAAIGQKPKCRATVYESSRDCGG